MRKTIICILVMVMCFGLCACGQEEEGVYDDLIRAIERDNYRRALAELQELMGVEPDEANANSIEEDSRPIETDSQTAEADIQPTVSELCLHSGKEASCTEHSYCAKCGELMSEALGHEYSDGECIRCKEADPADAKRLREYNNLMYAIEWYENNGALSVGPDFLEGSAAVKYLYDQLTLLGDYRDCAQYLNRISIVKDKLLYFELLEKDNLGNVVNHTNIDYAYDSQGRVIMSEDNEFQNTLGLFGNGYAHGESQSYVTITYGEDGRITEYKSYYVSLTSIITPTYDEYGRIQSAYHKTNTGGFTSTFHYDDLGRLLSIERDNGDRLSYVYNPDGTVASKTFSYGDKYVLDNITEYIYDDAGRLVSWKGDSTVPTVECDDQGRILKKTIIKNTGVVVHDYVYGDCYVYTQPEAAES